MRTTLIIQTEVQRLPAPEELFQLTCTDRSEPVASERDFLSRCERCFFATMAIAVVAPSLLLIADALKCLLEVTLRFGGN